MVLLFFRAGFPKDPRPFSATPLRVAAASSFRFMYYLIYNYYNIKLSIFKAIDYNFKLGLFIIYKL